MNAARHAWLRVALLVGVVYFLIGTVFALPANDLRLWRLSAWVVSGGAYAVHIAYELYRLGSTPRVGAAHIVLLAGAGMLHALTTASALRPTWLLALVVWPAVTAIPAFVGALVAGAVLARLPRSADGR
jgi:hypothetical protein